MGVRSKTLITVILVVGAVGVVTFTASNKNLFKGQIFNENGDGDVREVVKLPDLVPDLEILAPAEGKEDIRANATIKNSGEGEVTGETPFKYAIYINDEEVFSNTDSFSAMSPGDEFNFEYPIPKSIYNYSNSGTVKFVLDTDNAIEEADEGNNEMMLEYSF